jgi:energy-converting hydrogenase B subunit D
MSALQAVALLVVALCGTAVVMAGEPLRQTLMLGIYGFSLTLLFFVVQAPDVALSEIVVSGVGLPLIVLAALRKLAQHARSDDPEAGHGEKPGEP